LVQDNLEVPYPILEEEAYWEGSHPLAACDAEDSHPYFLEASYFEGSFAEGN